jgi:hypothetical protein
MIKGADFIRILFVVENDRAYLPRIMRETSTYLPMSVEPEELERHCLKGSVELFLTSIALIELSLINILTPPLCAWIHFQHHYGHVTKTPKQNNICVQINKDVLSNVCSVINLI